eukprot:112518-Prymnesium_polylepis.1
MGTAEKSRDVMSAVAWVRSVPGSRCPGVGTRGSAPVAVAESETLAVGQGGLRVRTCVGTLWAW